MTSLSSNHDDSIAIAKALGIIFVVIGHCCATPIQGGNSEWQIFICKYIYSFHMPLFFFLSGYFFNLRYIDDKRTFVKKKIKGLWLPFVKWALLFTVLHNLLLALGMYGEWQGYMPERYNLRTLIHKIILVFFLQGDDQLIGGFWFLPVLFFSAIYSMISLWFIRAVMEIIKSYIIEIQNKIPACNNILNAIFRPLYGGKGECSLKETNTNNERFYVIVVIFAMFFFLAGSMVLLLKEKSMVIIGISGMTFLASAIFLSGYCMHKIVRKTTIDVYKKNIFVIIGSVITIVGVLYHPISFRGVKFWYDVCYVWFFGCIGTWTWVVISQFISSRHGVVKNVLVYVGENTIIVLALHFSCFKIINLIKVSYYNLSEIPYGSFPIIGNDPSSNNIVWWLLYIFVGVGIPICVKFLYDSKVKKYR
ncbi:MAG: acyltransferase family protein [Paludibacteraceae bacterium]|nr:acyltransferase family protein [Paludibacteraceae bacterium]HPH63801.1 acyltransferase family protein [Paludibacteraceae bacterium]